MDRADIIEQFIANFDVVRRKMLAEQRINHKHDISPGQIHLLFLLRHEQPLTLSQLAARLSLTGGAVTQLVDPLVEKGILARKSSEKDRRIININLTAKGAEKLDKMKRGHQLEFVKALDCLTDKELTTLLKLQKKLLDSKLKQMNKK